MSLTILSPPASEPVTLDQVKAHLRVIHDDEDELIAGIVIAARQTIEAKAGLAMISQSWRLSLDCTPVEMVKVPVSPLQSVNQISILNNNGDPEILPTSSYDVAVGKNGRIRKAGMWPMPGVALEGIQIDFTAGWTDAASVPDDLKQATKLLTASFYEHREASTDTRIYAIPGAIDALIAPYRQVRV